MKKTRLNQPEKSTTTMTRRDFVKKTTMVSAAFASASFLGGQAPAFAQTRKIHYLQWTSFIPDADVDIDMQAAEFTKATGVQVTAEKINQNDMTPRITAAIESGEGADVMLLIENQPQLFAKGLADHNALIEELAGNELYDWARGAVVVDGVARAVPLFNVGNAVVYRKDVFDELGLAAPNTWDEYLKIGTTLKNNNMPVGQTLGHTFGDAPSFAYPLLWSFGGMETDEAGKVIINSPETIQAIEYLREFWEAACDPGGLAWDDTSNNRAFLGQTISATLNGASIYFVARRSEDKFPGLADKLAHFNNPEGPSGRFHTIGPRSPAIMEYSKEKEASADFIRFLFQDDNFSNFITVNNGYIQGLTPKWESHPVWESDPAIKIFSTNAKYGRAYGYAGPWNRASGEVKEKYIIIDIFARAAQGDDPKEIAAWAQKELENVYGA
jgi:multiple sugar transport system substrate-binding protein